jgi:predicted nucleic acid-binding protein
MSVLVDTGVVYAEHDTDAARHDAAAAALDAVYDGEYGQPFLSDYVYDEAITLTVRRGSFDPAVELGRKLRGVDPYPAVYELLYTSAPVFEDAIEVFETYDDQSLSFTDAATIALADRHGIDHVLSFDDDFDGLVSRLPPSTIGD